MARKEVSANEKGTLGKMNSEKEERGEDAIKMKKEKGRRKTNKQQ